MSYLYFLSSLFATVLFVFDINATKEESEKQEFITPLGLPPVPWPVDNLYDEKKAELGRLLYFDKRLSADGTVACASCHSIPNTFADNHPVSTGIDGHKGTRNSPTVINTAYQTHQFWDGRAKTLEEQCKGPIANPNEMADTDNTSKAHFECHERVKEIEGYRKLFNEVFGNDHCNVNQIAQAIATFERTILSGNSPYDRFMAGDKFAMTPEQQAGYRVFQHAGCNNCHFGFNFTDGRFLNIGVGMDSPNPDPGRYDVTKDLKDWGAFKVPTLREIANTGPYMHNGSLKTLEEVVDFYNDGGIPNKNLHTLMKPLHLTDQQKKDLVSFLQALSGEGWQHVKAPESFPN